MARRINGLRNLQSKSKVDRTIRKESLDYHEGLSSNQVKIILRQFGLEHKLDKFNAWMCGQTCPIVQRNNRDDGKPEQTCGVYEYDLFRWIDSQKKGTPLIWD